MLNFTVGPVMAQQYTCDTGANQIPYFRTEEFSLLMKENEKMLLSLLDAPMDSRAVFITGSGTASMEAAVMNTLNHNDKAVVVRGGSFGERFAQICDIHGIEHTDIVLQPGEALNSEYLEKIDISGCSAFLINVHETSTGVLYDMKLVGEYCRKNNLFLIADAISSFLADEFSMKDMGCNLVITSSQKALACPPGISMIAMDENALSRVENNDTQCMYLDIADALKNAERGQTPFTPAVGILIQLHERMKHIVAEGGSTTHVSQVACLAQDFREKIKELPFGCLTESKANAVTALVAPNHNAKKIVTALKDEYDIWVCGNGGNLGDDVFRVGHIGALDTKDNDVLIKALKDMESKGLL